MKEEVAQGIECMSAPLFPFSQLFFSTLDSSELFVTRDDNSITLPSALAWFSTRLKTGQYVIHCRYELAGLDYLRVVM